MALPINIKDLLGGLVVEGNRIPCHPEFVCDELRMDEKENILPVGEVWEPDVTEDVTYYNTDNEGVIKNSTDCY